MSAFRRRRIFFSSESIDNQTFPGQNYPKSSGIYKESDRITEKWSKILMSCLKVASTWVLLPKLIVNFYFYFKADSEDQDFDLPFLMWFPFDTKTVLGYSLAFLLQYVMFTSLFLIVGCILTLGIGGFIFGLSICNDLKNDLKSIKGSKKKSKIEKQLAKFIRCHSESTQLLIF